MRTASLPSPDANEMSLLAYLILHTKRNFQEKVAAILMDEPSAGQAFYCYDSMKATVDDGLMTWEEFSFNELEVFQIWQDAQRKEYQAKLAEWRGNLSAMSNAELGLLACLEDEVEMGNTSWENLGIHQESFLKLLRYAFKPRLKALLSKSELDDEDLELIELCRERTKAKKLSWRDLGVTHKEIKAKLRSHQLTA